MVLLRFGNATTNMSRWPVVTRESRDDPPISCNASFQMNPFRLVLAQRQQEKQQLKTFLDGASDLYLCSRASGALGEIKRRICPRDDGKGNE